MKKLNTNAVKRTTNYVLIAVSLLFSQIALGQVVEVNIDGTAGNDVVISVPAGTFFSTEGNITFQNGKAGFDNLGTVEVGGNWTQNTTTGGMVTPNAGTLLLDGAGAQNITSTAGGVTAVTLNSLTLGGANIKSILLPVNITGTLDLGTRELATGTTFLTVTTTGTIASTTSGFVSSLAGGYLARNTNSTVQYFFPVGSTTGGKGLRPLEIQPATTTSNTYKVRYIPANPNTALGTLTDGTICSVNTAYYHEVTQTGADQAIMTMYFSSALDGNYTLLSKWQGAPPAWTNMGTTTTGLSAYGLAGTRTTTATAIATSTSAFPSSFALTYSGVPAAPVATAATNNTSCTSFTANWLASVVSATAGTPTNYYLDVSTDGLFGSFTVYNALDMGLALTQPVSGLVSGTTYFYRVRAKNGCGFGPYSNIISVLTSASGTPVSSAVPLVGITATDYDGYITTAKKYCGLYYGGAAPPEANGTGSNGIPDPADMGFGGINGALLAIPPAASFPAGAVTSANGLTYKYTTNSLPSCGGSYFILDASTFNTANAAIGCSGYNSNALSNVYLAPTSCSVPTLSSVANGTSNILTFTGTTFAQFLSAGSAGVLTTYSVNLRYTITAPVGLNWNTFGSGATAKYNLKIPGGTTFAINVKTETDLGTGWNSGMSNTSDANYYNTQQGNCPYSTCTSLYPNYSAGNWIGVNRAFYSEHSGNGGGFANNTLWGRIYNQFKPTFQQDQTAPTAPTTPISSTVSSNGTVNATGFTVTGVSAGVTDFGTPDFPAGFNSTPYQLWRSDDNGSTATTIVGSAVALNASVPVTGTALPYSDCAFRNYWWRAYDACGNFTQSATALKIYYDNTTPTYNSTTITGADCVSGNTYYVKNGTTLTVTVNHSDNCGTGTQYLEFSNGVGNIGSWVPATGNVKAFANPYGVAQNGAYTGWGNNGGSGAMADPTRLTISPTVTCVATGNCSTNAKGNWSVTAGSGTSRSYVVDVFMYDQASNGVGYTNTGLTLYLDNTVPSTPGTPTIATGGGTNTQTWSTSGSTDGESGVSLYEWQYSTTSASGPWTNLTTNGTTTSPTINLACGNLLWVQVRAKDCAGNFGLWSTGTGNAYIIPNIGTNPSDQTICANGNASFTIGNLQGSGQTYQWQVSTNGGGLYTDITAAGSNPTYAGFNTSSTLTLTSAPFSTDGYMYRCVMSGTCPPPATSLAGTLHVANSTVVSVSGGNTTVCTNASVTLTANSNTLVNVYQWQSSPDNFTWSAAAGTNNAGTYTASTVSAGTTYYQVTVSSNCNNATSTNSQNVVVVNQPVVSTQPPVNTAVCISTPVTFTAGALSGTGSYTYQWYSNTANSTTSPAPVAVGTGATIASGSATTSYSPPTGTVGTMYYFCTFTPVGATNCGPLNSIIASLTVNPTPDVTNPGNQVKCNNTLTTAVNWSGTIGGTIYNWTNNTTSIGLAASGSGNIAAFTATNNTTTPVIATIIVTPAYTFGGTTCYGTPQSFTITVNPTPTVNAVADQVLCNTNGTAAINFTGNMTGSTVFSWVNNTTSIGLAASGSGNIASFTATNSGVSPVTATVIVTPQYTNSGLTCNGSAIAPTITVNPTPTVNAIGNQVVCNNTATTLVTFGGAVTGTVYDWTNNTTSIGLAASGTATSSIPAFTATNITTGPVTATITVTPKYTNAGTTCTGTPTSFTITVNPTPTVNAVANQVLCNTNGTAAINFTGNMTGSTVFSWVNNTTSIGLAASGSGNIASFTATNSGVSPVTATVIVTPQYTNSGLTCNGSAIAPTITVNPTPTVNAIGNQVVCNNTATTLVTFGGAVTGTVYDWTNNTTSIGLAASGTATSSIPAFTATNITTGPVTATITVTPKYTNAGTTCTGTPTSFTITVNSTTVLAPTATAANPISCSGFTANWTAPSGPPLQQISNYTLQVSLSNSFSSVAQTFTPTNSATAQAVASLTPGTYYYYRIRANYLCTTGNWSNIIQVFVSGLPSSPVVPTNPVGVTQVDYDGWITTGVKKCLYYTGAPVVNPTFTAIPNLFDMGNPVKNIPGFGNSVAGLKNTYTVTAQNAPNCANMYAIELGSGYLNNNTVQTPSLGISLSTLAGGGSYPQWTSTNTYINPSTTITQNSVGPITGLNTSTLIINGKTETKYWNSSLTNTSTSIVPFYVQLVATGAGIWKYSAVNNRVFLTVPASGSFDVTVQAFADASAVSDAECDDNTQQWTCPYNNCNAFNTGNGDPINVGCTSPNFSNSFKWQPIFYLKSKLHGVNSGNASNPPYIITTDANYGTSYASYSPSYLKDATAPTVTAAPTITSGAATNSQTWSAAPVDDESGLDAAGYVWQYNTDGVTWLTPTGNPTGSTATISGLPCDKTITVQYKARDCAQNLSGWSTVGTAATAPIPVPSFTSPTNNTTVCANTGVVYTTQPGQSNYVWTITPGTLGIDYTITAGTATPPASATNSITINWITPGSKTVFVGYTGTNSCVSTASATSTNTVDKPTISVSQVDVTCFGTNTGSITVTNVSGSPTYSYSKDGTTFPVTGQAGAWTFTGLTAGNYSVAMKDINGCISPVLPVTITQNGTGNLTQVISQVNVLCNGASTGSITVTPSGGVSPYTFTNNASTYTNPAQVGAYTWSGLTAGNYSVITKDANGCSTTTTPVVLTQTAVVTATASGQVNVLCNGANTGSVVITPGGGTPPYTFSKDNGVTYTSPAQAGAYTFTGLAAGTYQMIVKDANGCLSTALPVIIIQNTSVTATPSSQVNVLCNGASTGSVVITPSGGTANYTFSKDNGIIYTSPAQAGAYTFTGLAAGSYLMIVKDANGCLSASTPVVIIQPTSITTPGITITSNVTTCGGSNGIIDVTTISTGGTGVIQYSLNGGSYQSGTSFTGLAAGSYTVVAEDGVPCFSSTSNTVTIAPPASPNVSNFTMAATSPVCSGGVSTVTVGSTTLGNGTFTATYNLSAPNAATGLTASLTISSNSGTFSTPVLSNTGTTTVTITSITSAANCSSTPGSGNTANVVVNAGPTVSITGAAPVCVGGQVTLGTTVGGGAGSATNFQWQRSSNGGSNWTTVQNTTASSYQTDGGLNTGSYIYQVILTQSGSNCSATSSTVSANVADQPYIVNDPSGVSICKGGTAVLSAAGAGGTPGTLYLWEYTGSGAVSNNNPAGVTYSGTTTNTLTITTDNSTTPAGNTSYWLTVYASGIGCNAANAVTSIAVDVLVTADPIVSNPTPAAQPSVCSGGSPGGISVTASGGLGTLLYQWYSNTANSTTGGTLISGATGATYNPPSTPGTTYYYCVVSQAASGCGPVTTAATARVDVGSGLTPTVVVDECMNLALLDKYYVLVTGNGGTPPYTYPTAFYTSSTNQGVHEIAAGSTNNTFTVTDAVGCSATTSPVSAPLGHPTNIVLSSTTGNMSVDCWDDNFNKWVTFRDAVTNDAILAINDNHSSLGLVTVDAYKEASAPLIWANQTATNCNWTQNTAMRRHFKITTSNPPSNWGAGSSAEVMLFFTDQEYLDLKSDAWNNNIAYPNAGYACSQLDDVYGFNELYVTKYTGANEDGNYLNNTPTGLYRVYGDNTSLPLTKGQYTGSNSTGFQGIYGGAQTHHYVQLTVSEFSEFWIHGSQQSQALPVEMIFLQADAINNAYIKLTWATAIEINNDGFEVERSVDGQTWTQIGWVDGHGNATTQNNYSFDDVNVVANVVYYYRLKQVDNDGVFEYTDIVSARINGDVTFSVKDFVPNPTMDKTNLIVTASKDQEITVTFYDVIGQKMMESTHEINRGGNRIEFELGKLAGGTYTAVVSSANEIYTKKVVLTK